MELYLTRREYRPDCTKGELRHRGSLLCYTLEPAWRNNELSISCIPNGRYEVTRWDSPRFGECWKLLRTPDRTDILMHTGNYPTDTEGCIIVGKKYAYNESAVYESRLAMLALDKLLPNRFWLNVESFKTNII